MILYHAISIYQLLICMCLRFLRASDKSTVCILPDFIVRKFPEYKCLEEQGIFDRVVLYPYTKVPITTSMEIIERMGNSFWKHEFCTPLHDFEEVFCGGTHFHFASYLVSQKIHFCYIEDGSGIWADIDGFKKAQRKIDPAMYEVTEANGLYDGSSPYIDRIYAYIPSDAVMEEKRFSNPKLCRFNVVEELKKLSATNVDKICKSFGYQRIQLPSLGEATVFLTDHAANMDFLTWDEQIGRNLLTIDYFHSQSKLVIKPHPDDLTKYHYYFPDALILPHLFPVELLLGLSDCSCASIITFGSTSVNHLKVQKVANLWGEYIHGGYHKIHRLYVAWKLYQEVNEIIPCALDVLGNCENVFQAFKSNTSEYQAEGMAEGNLLMVCSNKFSSTQLKETLNKDKTMILLDEMYDDMLDIIKDEFSHFLPKKIEIINENEDSARHEFLYVFSTDENMMRAARDFHCEKN